MPKLSEFIFKSSVPFRSKHALEQLIYFNPQQYRYQNCIAISIEKLGLPTIIENNGSLSLSIGKQKIGQALFAIDPILEDGDNIVGAIIYHRIEIEQILILHIAVSGAYVFKENKGNKLLTFSMISEVLKIAKRIRGVTKVGIIYSNRTSGILEIPLNNHIGLG